MYTFTDRHNGPKPAEINEMLQCIGVSSLDTLIDKTVPASIRLKSPLKVSQALSEHEYLQHLRVLASKNKIFKNFIGQEPLRQV
jgi:glycine dehydrogenase